MIIDILGQLVVLPLVVVLPLAVGNQGSLVDPPLAVGILDSKAAERHIPVAPERSYTVVLHGCELAVVELVVERK